MGWYTNYKIWVRTASGFSRSTDDIEKQIESVANAAKFLNCEEKHVEAVCEICSLQPKKYLVDCFSLVIVNEEA